MHFCWPEDGGACGKDLGDLQELSGLWLPDNLSYNHKGLNSVNNKMNVGVKFSSEPSDRNSAGDFGLMMP